MRVALITGSSRGIGAASAVALARRGFHVCLTARCEERLAEVAEQINRAVGPDRVLVAPGDVAKPDDRDRALAKVRETWDHVDVLVNNAGSARPGVVEDLDLSGVQQLFAVNTFGYLAWMKMLLPAMRRRGTGRIVNISSVSGLMSFPGLSAYAATKFAVEAISDAARREYGPWGVKVILVEPGPVTTGIWEAAESQVASNQEAWMKGPFRRLYKQLMAHSQHLRAGHGASPEIVARAVCRAATAARPKARYAPTWDARITSILRHLPDTVQDWLVSWLTPVR